MYKMPVRRLSLKAAVFSAALFLFSVVPVFTQLPVHKTALIPDDPRPGDPVTVILSGYPLTGVFPDKNFRAVLRDKNRQVLAQALFFPVNDIKADTWAAFITVPSTARPDSTFIIIENGNDILGMPSLIIKKRDFVYENIALNQTLSDLRSRSDPQKDREASQLASILRRTGAAVYSNGPFIAPVTSTRRTSFFGDRRIFKYADGTQDASVHAGVDYGVATGTEVSAAASGVVVFARPRIITGNSVVLEHLPGVYSLYYHLDKIEVTEGAQIAKGGRIGLSGATGLATGPHLHWEIRVSGENTDPDALVARDLLDKDVILSKIGR
jgi:murein DD-endopeptidase MepM/ murein hydrolase activator NlpD